MKKTALNTLWILPMLLVPVLAQEGQPGKPARRPANIAKDQGAPAPETGIDDQVLSELDRICTELCSQGEASSLRPENLAGLAATIARIAPGAAQESKPATLQRRLRMAVVDLEGRTEKAALQKADLLYFREQLWDLRLTQSFDRLQALAQSHSLKPAHWSGVKDLLQERSIQVASGADAAQIAAEQALQGKLAVVLAQLAEQEALEGAEQRLLGLREPLLEHRLARALDRLEQNALAKRAGESDVALLAAVVEDYDQLGEQGEKAKLILTRYLGVIDGLKARAVSGELTRDEFVQLKSQLSTLARTVLSGN